MSARERQTIPVSGGGAIHLDLPCNDTYGHFDLSIVAPQGPSAAVYLTAEEVACLSSLLTDVLADEASEGRPDGRLALSPPGSGPNRPSDEPRRSRA